jgi:ApaG protein
MKKYQFTVQVTPRVLEQETHPEAGRYAFSYTVSILNTGQVAAQLISRHWVITDAHGKVEQVQGLGVVGHQPLLKPGEGFEYQSWTRLATPNGSMGGSFFCVAEDGEKFDAPVPPFMLSYSRNLH